MVNIGVMLLYPKSVRILSVKLSLQNQIFTDQSHVSGELVVFCPYLVNSKFLLSPLKLYACTYSRSTNVKNWKLTIQYDE